MLTLAGSVRFRRERRPTVTMMRLELDQGLVVGDLTMQPGNVLDYNEYDLDFTFGLIAAGEATVAGIDGVVRYRTERPFTGLVFLPYPWLGSMLVDGADGSMLTIRMTDFTSTINIDVDADGDGDPEETLTADWNTL